MSITAATENRKCVDSLYVTIKLFADRKKLNILIDDYYYEYILKMAQLNGKRNLKMPKNIQKDIFCVYAQFVRREFKNYRSKNDMEYALHNGCFELYRICSIL
jgi:hypothetical protein